MKIAKEMPATKNITKIKARELKPSPGPSPITSRMNENSGAITPVEIQKHMEMIQPICLILLGLLGRNIWYAKECTNPKRTKAPQMNAMDDMASIWAIDIIKS